MTEVQKNRFIARFSEDYNLPAAAAAAGIGRGEAYRLLRGARAEVDRLVLARLTGAAMTAIRREYEAIAFGGGEDVRPGDRIRALEQLRVIASAETEESGAPPLTVRYEYV